MKGGRVRRDLESGPVTTKRQIAMEEWQVSEVLNHETTA